MSEKKKKIRKEKPGSSNDDDSNNNKYNNDSNDDEHNDAPQRSRVQPNKTCGTYTKNPIINVPNAVVIQPIDWVGANFIPNNKFMKTAKAQ